jgi:hypothetical protein
MLNVLTEKQVEETIQIKPVGSAIEIRRMQAWLNERIKRGKKEKFAEVITLTPVLASLLLQINQINRPISKHNAENLKNDVLAKRFLYNGQSISVLQNGLLGDGQHRCETVLATGMSIETVIAFGVPDEARYTIDTGKPKSAGNYLHMKGFKDGNNIAAAIRLLLQYRGGIEVGSGHNRATTAEVLTTADDLRGIQSSMDIASGGARLGVRSILAFCHFVFKKRADVETADEFVTKLIDGDGLRKGNPIYHCRERLLQMRGSARANDKVKIIFRAWNHWRLNETVNKIVLPVSLPKVER